MDKSFDELAQLLSFRDKESERKEGKHNSKTMKPQTESNEAENDTNPKHNDINTNGTEQWI